MAGNFQILGEETISSPKNPKFQIVDATILTPDSHTVVWQYIQTRDAVGMVALDHQHRIYCVRQWRPARKDYVWELPAGGIDIVKPDPGQILENANRELQEEIGMRAGRLEILASFSPGVHITCTFHIVLAQDLTPASLPGDIGENIEIKLLPFAEAYDLLTHQQLPTSTSLIGLLLAKPFI
jgi:8-oxo-dGTP pyrophosphatase MutT (NUDIX family)